MPKLSLYSPTKQNDYKFMDTTISEMLTVGGTDLYIHKYLGPDAQTPSVDYTQPQYLTTDPNQIQDLLFLENRDRKYDPNIYRLRGHYSVQNLDFDLSQFGLFLNNDIIFITVHYNDMIDIVGRKLMVGDVLELPHLLDYNPLKETIPVALKRFYQITDSNFASEGFSQTWYPHLWRIKCEPLVDSEEFSNILKEPINQDNYLGDWDKTKTYAAGYVVSFGDKNYISITDVPANTSPPDSTYWRLDTGQNLKDILATYNRNIEINNAQLEEAKRIVPKAGYDRSKLYIVPTYGVFEENGVKSNKFDQPAPPEGIEQANDGPPNVNSTGTILFVSNPSYSMKSAALRIPKATVENLWNMTVDGVDKLVGKNPVSLQVREYKPAPLQDVGTSRVVENDRVLTILPLGPVTGPYGTADNTYATADQNPVASGFTGTEPYGPQTMNYRADCDPAFQFIMRASPRSFGYTSGYLDGTGEAPNGIPTGAGISFPQSPQVGDYFLRIDYLPQILYRWDGQLWVRISTKVRTDTGFTYADKSQLSGFINDDGEIYVNNQEKLIKSAQPLSQILNLPQTPIPPEE